MCQALEHIKHWPFPFVISILQSVCMFMCRASVCAQVRTNQCVCGVGEGPDIYSICLGFGCIQSHMVVEWRGVWREDHVLTVITVSCDPVGRGGDGISTSPVQRAVIMTSWRWRCDWNPARGQKEQKQRENGKINWRKETFPPVLQTLGQTPFQNAGLRLPGGSEAPPPTRHRRSIWEITPALSSAKSVANLSDTLSPCHLMSNTERPKIELSQIRV